MPKRGKQDRGEDEQPALESEKKQRNKKGKHRHTEEHRSKDKLELKAEQLRSKEAELQNKRTEARGKQHLEGENKQYWEGVLKDLAEQEKKLDKEKEHLERKEELQKEKEKIELKEEQLQNKRTEARGKQHLEGENKQHWEEVLKDLAEQEKKLDKEKEHLERKEEELRRDWKDPRAIGDNISWNEVSWNRDAVGYKEEGNLFCLDRSFLDQGCSGQAERQQVLFCRECFNEQWKFIEERVRQEGCLGWILGPPGTGKSTTTMSFVQSLSMQEGWKVMCVRLWKWGAVNVLQAEDGVLRITDLPRNGAEEMLRGILRGWTQSGKKYLVSLDGYQQDVHDLILSECVFWLNHDRDNRRVVITTSMSSREKKKIEQDRIEKVEELMVYSWTLEEYLEAVKYDLFYKSVAGVVELSSDTTEGSEETRSRDVESKYQIVGGSCRYMFECTTDQAIRDLRGAMDSVCDFQTLFDMRTGDRTKQFVNRLHGKYRNGNQVYWSFVSRFVATELAEKLGESFVRKIEELPGATENPSLRGVLFEMLFFARIGREAGLQVALRPEGEEAESENQGESEKRDDWKGCSVKPLEAREVDQARMQGTNRLCLKPLRWNQGGYDAVIVDLYCKLVRFVQVTIAETHDLKLRYMYDCLKTLSIEEGGSWKVEVVFVVPKENLYKFRISNVENRGILTKYGWARGEEEIDAHVAGMSSRPQGCCEMDK